MARDPGSGPGGGLEGAGGSAGVGRLPGRPLELAASRARRRAASRETGGRRQGPGVSWGPPRGGTGGVRARPGMEPDSCRAPATWTQALPGPESIRP
jgi:hypothetical protein